MTQRIILTSIAVTLLLLASISDTRAQYSIHTLLDTAWSAGAHAPRLEEAHGGGLLLCGSLASDPFGLYALRIDSTGTPVAREQFTHSSLALAGSLHAAVLADGSLAVAVDARLPDEPARHRDPALVRFFHAGAAPSLTVLHGDDGADEALGGIAALDGGLLMLADTRIAGADTAIQLRTVNLDGVVTGRGLYRRDAGEACFARRLAAAGGDALLLGQLRAPTQRRLLAARFTPPSPGDTIVSLAASGIFHDNLHADAQAIAVRGSRVALGGFSDGSAAGNRLVIAADGDLVELWRRTDAIGHGAEALAWLEDGSLVVSGGAATGGQTTVYAPGGSEAASWPRGGDRLLAGGDGGLVAASGSQIARHHRSGEPCWSAELPLSVSDAVRMDDSTVAVTGTDGTGRHRLVLLRERFNNRPLDGPPVLMAPGDGTILAAADSAAALMVWTGCNDPDPGAEPLYRVTMDLRLRGAAGRDTVRADSIAGTSITLAAVAERAGVTVAAIDSCRWRAEATSQGDTARSEWRRFSLDHSTASIGPARDPVPDTPQITAHPNPGNDQVLFTLHGELPPGASLAVFDLLGRRVALLPLAAASEGSAKVVWRTEVPSGVYFVRLTGSPGPGASLRVVVLR